MSSPSTTRNSKLVFVRAPAHKRRGTVDTEQDKGRLPDNIPGLGIGSLLPDIGVPVLRRGNDAVGVRSPVYGSNRFVVLFRGDQPRGWSNPDEEKCATHLGECIDVVPVVTLAGIDPDFVGVQADSNLYDICKCRMRTRIAATYIEHRTYGNGLH